MSRISGITGTSSQSFAIDSDGYNIKLSVENNEIIIRDNSNIKQSIGTTSGGTGQTTYATGDILYSNATDSLTKRSIGSTGEVLTVAGGVPTWAAPTVAETIDINMEKAVIFGQSNNIGAISNAIVSTFTPITVVGGSPWLGVTDLAYLGNGQILAAADNYLGGGTCYVRKSYDFGRTWVTKAISTLGAVRNMVYAGNGYCIGVVDISGVPIYSSNYGETWSNASSFTSGYATKILKCKDNQVITFYETSGTATVYSTTNYGAAWGAGYSYTSDSTKNSAAIYCGDGYLIASKTAAGGYNAIRSINNGANWTPILIDTGYVTTSEIKAMVYCGNGICIAAANQASLYIAKSTDFGATWSRSSSTYPAMSHLLYLGGGRVIMCPTAGVSYYESLDYGDTWTNKTVNSNDFPSNIISSCILDDGTLILGKSDGTIYRIPTLSKPTLGEYAGGTNQSTYTTGDILYASATNTLTKRTIGSAGQVLTVAGGIPTWAAPGASVTGFTIDAATAPKYSATALGVGALTATASAIYGTTAIGFNALNAMTSNSDSGDTAVGYKSGLDLISSYHNTLIGGFSGASNTILEKCVFIGQKAGDNAKTSSAPNLYSAIGIGWYALSGTNAAGNPTITASGSIAVGANAGKEIVYSNSIYIGLNAGRITASSAATATSGQGDGNIFIGYQCGVIGFTPPSFPAAMSNSIVIGRQAQTATSNVAVIGGTAYPINMGINMTTPTARLHLPAGEAAAGKAPLKLTTGIALSAIEDGAMEYHSSHLYFSIGSTRYQLDQQGGGAVAHNSTTGIQGGSGTDGYYHLTANQNNWVVDGYNNGLWSTRYSGSLTPASTSTITVSNLKVIPGMPVRTFDTGSPTIYGDTNSNITSVDITNCVSLHCDYRGMLYFSIIDDTGGYFHVNCYDDSLKTHLVFHTATFNSIGSKAIVADATSTRGGLSFAGTITIAGTIIANASIVYQFYKYSICTAYDGTTLTIAGQPLSLTASSLKEIAIGNNELVVEVDCNIPGAYGSVTTNTALQTYRFEKRYWNKGPGHLVMLQGANITNDTGATQCKIALYNGGVATIAAASELTMSTTLARTVVELVSTTCRMEWGAALELRVVRGTVGDANSLYAQALVVLEGK